MHRTPLVSILIPYYNHKQYVGQTLDGILNDTYPNKEIVIINDGSTDTDISVINDWIEKNSSKLPINFISRANKGITKTFNELARTSKGEYIIFCASDDYLINNTISDRVSILEKNQEKMVLIADTSVVDGNGKTIHKSSIGEWLKYSNKENYFSDDGLKYEIINRWSLTGPCSMMNKKLFIESGGYDESLFLEDWDFYLRAAANNSILYFDQQVAAYRLHCNNFTSSSNKNFKLLQSLYLTAKKNYKLYNKPYKRYLLRKKVSYQFQLIFKHPSSMIRGILKK
jgi:glycosyltransferase involved in cell wall biosynthesis